MKSVRIPSRLAFAACLCISSAAGREGVSAGRKDAVSLLDFDSVKTLVMVPNGVSEKDLSMAQVLLKPDRFRLSRVEDILREPFRLDAVAAEILSRTAPQGPLSALPLHPDSLWPLLDVRPSRESPNPLPATPRPAGDADTTHAAKAPPGIAKTGFRPELDLAAIRAGLAEHAADLTGAERDFLFREAPTLFLHNVEDTALTAVQNELRRQEEEARTRRIMELAGKLRWAGLADAAAAAWRLQAWLTESARDGSLDAAAAGLRKAAGKDFPVHIGGKGPDRHVAGHGIWIDAGGDDEYVFAGPGKPGSFTLILDAGGNDLYRSRDSLSVSAGNMGIGLLADLGGDDRYLGSDFAQGSALFGYSSVFDAAGNDYYEGRCASLGFAFFGIGILQDESGNDVYSASLMSQGAGSTMGAGLLLDRAGDDRYVARPTFQDDLRYTNHYIQMVQGFATGFSPDYAGGIGLLRDGRGDDAYLADIFGQGSGYWYALGLLVDEAGDDRYEAHQYAQGAGVHIAVGGLLDFGGNDRYASKGVSQGCGHDYGIGVLFENGGDDFYLATDMSQGAGSANGVGILQDAAGKDIYQSINPDLALGHADMRRDRGSFGFFLDRSGKDRYSGGQGDGSAWRVFNGKTKGNGFGLDK